MANRQILVEILGNSQGYTKATQDATNATTKFGNVMQGIGQGLGQAAFGLLQTGIQDVKGFISDAIAQADLLNKSISKSNVVFGDSTGQIEAWANTTANAFGLSATAALDNADAIGNLATSAGLTEKKAASLSIGVVQLAADLGSFNNISTDEALTKLEAGLAGSTKGLKTLGIVMTAHEVEQQALADGAHKVNGAYTDAALTVARYEVILAKSSTASGDFARNTNSLADAQARMNAELQNAQAELGQQMLPAQVAVTNAQSDFFKGLGVVNKALGNFGNMLNDSYVSTDIFANQMAIATDATAAFAQTGTPLYDWSTQVTGALSDAGGAAQNYADNAAAAAEAARKATTDGTLVPIQAVRYQWEGMARMSTMMARQSGMDAAVAYGTGLHSGESAVTSALKQLTDDMKTELSRPRQVAALEAGLASKELGFVVIVDHRARSHRADQRHRHR